MNRTAIPGHKGDLYCRPTTGLDVCKFFLLNYVLHAFTIISEPGAGMLTNLFHSGIAVLLPYSGVQYSSYIIGQSMARCRDDLARAAKARALCFLIPARFRRGELVSPAMTTVHGRIPIDSFSARRATPTSICPNTRSGSEDQGAAGPYELVLVPPYAPVEALLPEDSTATTCTTGRAIRYPTAVACNSNIMKSAIAMLQIGYGSYELYDAYKGQFERFGYAAYALTVIPYILMSFLNLTASLLQPGYNAMFLVRYRGEKDYQPPLRGREAAGMSSGGGSGAAGSESCLELANNGGASSAPEGGEKRAPWMVDAEAKTAGAIGRVYSLTDNSQQSWLKHNRTLVLQQTLVVSTTSTISFILPYIMIHIMTHFQPAHSTAVERFFTVTQLVVGQLVCLFGDQFTTTLSRTGRTLFRLPAETFIIRPPPFLRYFGWSENRRVTVAVPLAYRYPCAADLEYIWNMGWGKVCLFVVCSLMAVVPTLGGFVVVGRMILKDQHYGSRRYKGTW
ncbi:hypothetical protein DFP73DRAFT_528074 [Morchella snyderi]|nr:hypothetical protein DFP73DRAFT_528074 [Morchella snyderi]